MDFIINDIPKKDNNGTTVNNYGSSGSVTIPDYLALKTTETNIDSGIIQKYTVDWSAYKTVSGDTATYLISPNGWIFRNNTTNIASIDNTGVINANGLNLYNDTKSVNLDVNDSGDLVVSGSEMQNKPFIQSEIDGVAQDFLINPEGGNVTINGTESEGYRLNVKGTVQVESINIKNGSYNANLTVNEIGQLQNNGKNLGAHIYKYSELSTNTFSDDDTTNSVNAYTTKKLYNDLQAQLNDKTFKYNQNTPSSNWIINHNLNKYPSVMVIDSAGTVCEGSINYVDINNITITFSAGFSGSATLN